MSKVVVIGSGPAGISAALYTARAGIDTTVITKGMGALERAEHIQNYYGITGNMSGKELAEAGIKGAKEVGVSFINEEVVGISFDGSLKVRTQADEYSAQGIVIATGTSRETPDIKGLKEFEGKGVSYCAVCDAFFYRGRHVCVLGSGEYAAHEAAVLMAVAKKVTVLTNGGELKTKFPDNVDIVTEKISQLQGEARVEEIIFENAGRLRTDGVFVAYGVAGSTALARKIGAVIENGKIVVDSNMATNIPGLYAAGDCTGGMLQIAKAVYEGAKAGTELVRYLRKNK